MASSRILFRPHHTCPKLNGQIRPGSVERIPVKSDVRARCILEGDASDGEGRRGRRKVWPMAAKRSSP
eukprot:7176048-Heterocapsa_arctica.AAC.1